MPTIIVPSKECPLNVLAALGPAIKSAEILLDCTVIDTLSKSANNVTSDDDAITYSWDATDKYTPTSIKIAKDFIECNKYTKVLEINSERITFKQSPDNPSFSIYLKME